MKLTISEIILSGCIAVLVILLIETANVEENTITQLEHDKTELKAQLSISREENTDADVIISSLTNQLQ